MIRLINNIAKLYKFSDFNNKQPKNLNHYLKLKKNEQKTSDAQKIEASPQNLKVMHRLLYLQCIPIVILALPVFYFIPDASSTYFLMSCNLIQYYASGLLCFNAFFTQEKNKHIFAFLLGISLCNCISGPYGVISPLILTGLSLYFPFTDERYHKFETEEHEANIQVYMAVQGLFYFMLIVTLTLKFYHFLCIKEMDTKINKLEDQNRQFYKEQQKLL